MTSRSRERSRSPRRVSRSPRRDYSPRRSRRDSPRRKYHDPVTEPSNVLGVFGLSAYTKEKELEESFSKFGKIEKVVIVYDQRSQQSRGFGFITFANVEDATKAKDEMNGTELDRKSIRVDYSKTKRGHDPTPGEYRGERRNSPRRYRRSPSPRRYRRSPSPRRYRD